MSSGFKKEFKKVYNNFIEQELVIEKQNFKQIYKEEVEEFTEEDWKIHKSEIMSEIYWYEHIEEYQRFYSLLKKYLKEKSDEEFGKKVQKLKEQAKCFCLGETSHEQDCNLWISLSDVVKVFGVDKK